MLLVSCILDGIKGKKQCENLMHVAAFIGELQHYKNFKPSYLSIGKWAIRPFLSDQVTFLGLHTAQSIYNFTHAWYF